MKELSYCLIVNRASNSGKCLHTITKHLSLIKNTLKNVEVYELGENESIVDIASLKAETFNVIVACGGDGTARKVAIGIKDHDVLFGVLPLGSGNDFAKMLNLSSSLEVNLKVLEKAETSTLDLGILNDTFFINTLGLGFDGYTNYLASKSKIKGSLKYVLSGIKALITAKAFDATINCKGRTESFHTLMILIANGKWEGGKYFVSPNSLNNDGYLELIILKSISKIRLAIEFIKLSLGSSLSSDLIKLTSIQKTKITTSIPVYTHADGEIEKSEQHFSIDISPKKLNVIFRSV